MKKEDKIIYSKEVEESRWEVIDILVNHYDEGFQIYDGFLNYHNDHCPLCKQKMSYKEGVLDTGFVNPCPVVVKNDTWVILYTLCHTCEMQVATMAKNKEWMSNYSKELVRYLYDYIEKETINKNLEEE